MEDAVQGLFDLDPNAIAIVAINDDRGIAGTQYYGCGVEDKGRMIHHINEDIVMDIILNNADTIIPAELPVMYYPQVAGITPTVISDKEEEE